LLTALAIWGAIAVSQAGATIIPVDTGMTPNGNGTTTFTYRADLASDQRADTGDFLTIYDFAGLVPGSAKVDQAGWTLTVQNVGITPTNVLPTDNPTVPNITITRTGGTISGPVTGLITFSAISSFGGTGGFTTFAAQATRSSGFAVGTKIQNIGLVGAPNAVPEPASLALLGITVPFVVTVLRRRRKSAN